MNWCGWWEAKSEKVHGVLSRACFHSVAAWTSGAHTMATSCGCASGAEPGVGGGGGGGGVSPPYGFNLRQEQLMPQKISPFAWRFCLTYTVHTLFLYI